MIYILFLILCFTASSVKADDNFDLYRYTRDQNIDSVSKYISTEANPLYTYHFKNIYNNYPYRAKQIEVSAFDFAIYDDNLEIVEIFCKHGFLPPARSIAIAIFNKRLEILDVLEKYLGDNQELLLGAIIAGDNNYIEKYRKPGFLNKLKEKYSLNDIISIISTLDYLNYSYWEKYDTQILNDLYKHGFAFTSIDIESSHTEQLALKHFIDYDRLDLLKTLESFGQNYASFFSLSSDYFYLLVIDAISKLKFEVVEYFLKLPYFKDQSDEVKRKIFDKAIDKCNFKMFHLVYGYVKPTNFNLVYIPKSFARGECVLNFISSNKMIATITDDFHKAEECKKIEEFLIQKQMDSILQFIEIDANPLHSYYFGKMYPKFSNRYRNIEVSTFDFAIYRNNIEIVELFCKHGFLPPARSIAIAIFNKRLEILDVLEKYLRDNQELLLGAIIAGDNNYIEKYRKPGFLNKLKEKYSLNDIISIISTLDYLHYSYWEKYDTQILNDLYKHGFTFTSINVESPNTEQQALELFVICGRKDLLQTLESFGQNYEPFFALSRNNKYLLISSAIYSLNLEVVEYFLKLPYFQDQTDEIKRELVGNAINVCNLAMLNLVYDYVKPVDFNNLHSMTFLGKLPLYYICHEKIVAIARNNLDRAEECGKIEDFLIKKGVNLSGALGAAVINVEEKNGFFILDCNFLSYLSIPVPKLYYRIYGVKKGTGYSEEIVRSQLENLKEMTNTIVQVELNAKIAKNYEKYFIQIDPIKSE